MTVRDTQMVRDQKKFENHWPNAINNSEWGFCVFLKKEEKPVSFHKKT